MMDLSRNQIGESEKNNIKKEKISIYEIGVAVKTTANGLFLIQVRRTGARRNLRKQIYFTKLNLILPS